ncbi:MAG: DUF3990 domain-containing protein [Lachnospiraceae bacterium]|nr:DUF3990 domain-containing protein [Lachnospiraceae bacterium]
MIVYHGSVEIIEAPDILHSYRALDFGKGFYVTTVKEQAERWAKRKADIMNKTQGIVNIYRMSENTIDLKEKAFGENLEEWLDFVCDCRDGGKEYSNYDLIVGKVADDKVFRVVDLYHTGIWDRERALKEIKVYPTYDQIAFITQKAIDSMLRFESYIEV